MLNGQINGNPILRVDYSPAWIEALKKSKLYPRAEMFRPDLDDHRCPMLRTRFYIKQISVEPPRWQMSEYLIDVSIHPDDASYGIAYYEKLIQDDIADA